ncbi:taurine ABC transporter permease TauC [Yersinia kristensenii]|uniref:taurine ABC transporter permease TauC n=1 Tax=Yersinia kristensenii TaxID=28152 RepID=UPI0018E290E4|nr:taurine ABC transporter permease TauC [Yersinia kristensenii]
MSLHSTIRDNTLRDNSLRQHGNSLPAPGITHPTPRKITRRSLATKGFWLSIATLVSVVALWWAVTALQLISPLFLPAPQQVLHQLLVIASPQGFMDATLWQHLAASLGRILIALLAAVALGVPTGIAMGLSSTVRGVLDPLIEIYRPVPPLAYLPLMVIWFGIGETSKILLIYLAIFAPITLAAVAGVRSVAQVRVRAARVLGASRWQVLWFVILPSALPEILTGIRIGLGVGWSTLVAAELIAATRGLGFMVQSAGEFLATDVVIAGISVIAIIAFGMELSLRAIQRRLTPWYGAQQ